MKLSNKNRNRALIAFALSLIALIFAVSAGTSGATTKTEHTTYPHPECEDDTYGNQYCDTTTVPHPPTTVKCPPKSTTTTVVTTTTVKPTTTVPQSTTTIPETTTTTVEIPEVGGPPQTVSRPAPPVVVNSPEFHHEHPEVPTGVTPISFTG